MTPRKLPSKNQNLAFEVWKYYGGIGGSDKDTMIKIVTWLLGFSTFVIGAYATGKFNESFPVWLLPIIGLLISALAAFISLMYGAYAAWNWSIADRIAENKGWQWLMPTYDPFTSERGQENDDGKSVTPPAEVEHAAGPTPAPGERSIETDDAKAQKEANAPVRKFVQDLRREMDLKIIRRLARPCQDRIALVFWAFFFASLLSLLAHAVLLCKTQDWKPQSTVTFECVVPKDSAGGQSGDGIVCFYTLSR